MKDRHRVTRLGTELVRHASDGDALAADFERWTDEQLATAPPHRWPLIVMGDSRFHHRVIAHHLLRRAMTVLVPEGRIHDALRMAEAASTILDTLAVSAPDDAALTTMRAEAFVDQATFLTWLSRYGDALDTIELAEMFVATILTPDADLVRARLLFARAIIYADPDVCRYDDALALLERAGDAFRVLDQIDRGFALQRVRADVMMALNQLEQAHALLFDLLTPSGITADHERARLMHHIAMCAMLMGNADEALHFGNLARAALTRLGNNPAEVGRADWLIGRALEIAGDNDAAADALNRAAEAFARADLLDLWVRARLDYVHVVLVGDPDADVRILCESIAATSIALDQRDANRRRHCTAEALDYLRRAAMRQELSADTVAYVRAYLDEIAVRPVRRFVPPVPEQTM